MTQRMREEKFIDEMERRYEETVADQIRRQSEQKARTFQAAPVEMERDVAVRGVRMLFVGFVVSVVVNIALAAVVIGCLRFHR